MAIFLALVHHPVLNKRGEVVATALTNVDVHDISRSARSYGIDRLYVVTPVTLQQRMVAEIVGHWTVGEGARLNPLRAEAMCRVTAASSLEAACSAIAEQCGQPPLVVVTSAQMPDADATWQGLRKQLRQDDRPVLIVFGTGWGLAPDVLAAADLRLAAIVRDPGFGPEDDGYNHLSVRSATAIALDRLLGSH
jgi:hypothetical protein